MDTKASVALVKLTPAFVFVSVDRQRKNDIAKFLSNINQSRADNLTPRSGITFSFDPPSMFKISTNSGMEIYTPYTQAIAHELQDVYDAIEE